MVLSNQYAQIYHKRWWKILHIVKHCLIDTDCVYTEGSASAEKTGFENKNLRVLKEILLPRIIYDFEAVLCNAQDISKTCSFLSSFTFFLYFDTSNTQMLHKQS